MEKPPSASGKNPEGSADSMWGGPPWSAADALVGLLQLGSRTRGSGADGGVRLTFIGQPL